MKQLPPLNALRAFEAAARLKSFKDAANELFVTQGAISRQVKILEDHLGAKLFVRLHRGVELTRPGRLFFEEVHDSFRRILNSCAQFSSSTDPNTLKVKLTPSPAICWLVPRLFQFHAKHPGIAVQVTTSHEPVNFSQEDADIAIFYGPPEEKELVVDEMFKEILTPVCSPQLLKNSTFDGPEALHKEVLLYSLRRQDHWSRWFEYSGLGSVPEDQKHLVLENSAFTYHCAAEGLGVALGQLAFVANDVASGKLISPFDVKMPSGYAYFLAFPRHKQRFKKVTAFRNWVAEQTKITRSSDSLL